MSANLHNAIAVLLAAGITGFSSWRISINQNEVTRKMEKSRNDYQNFRHYLDGKSRLENTRKELMNQLYGTPHREVSECTRILNSTIAKSEGIGSNLISDFKAQYDKINDCRSLVRDNMAYIRSILAQYETNLNVAQELASNAGQMLKPNLLTFEDEYCLKKRFESFKNCSEHIDKQMYGEKYDSSLYNWETFEKHLVNCNINDG